MAVGNIANNEEYIYGLQCACKKNDNVNDWEFHK